MRIAQKPSQSASVLLTVLIFTVVLSALVASSLMMMSSRRIGVERSMKWNDAFPLAEAGLEEALTQLQFTTGTNFGTNGWTAVGNTFVKTRTNFVNYGYYTAVIQLPATNAVGYGPTLIATGSVVAPLSSGQYISRVVSVQTVLNGGYAYGLLSKSTINLNPTGGAYVDSYDSQDPLYSTNGFYTVSKRRANAGIGSTSTSSTINLSASFLYGYIIVPPSYVSNSIVLQTQGVVGDIPYDSNAAHLGSIESGHYRNTLTTTIAEVALPYTSGIGFAAGNYIYQGTNFNYGLGTGNYITNGNFSLNSGQTMVVTGHAVLYVNGGFNVNGGSAIYIAPGASLTVYVALNCTVAGTINNSSGQATKCVINGLTFCTDMVLTPATPFIAIVNTPDANVNATLSAGADMSGAIIGYSIALGGSGSFHYDEGLAANSSNQYTVTGWKEF